MLASAHVLTLTPVLVTLLISAVLPAVTAFVTKETAHPAIKVVVAAILSLVTAFVTSAVQANGSAVFTKQALLLFAGSFIAQQTSFHSLGQALQINSKVAPSVGIGAAAPDTDATEAGEPVAPIAT